MPVTELVSYRLADGVATIAMDDGKVNALSLDMIAAVNTALDRAVADGAVVVLTGRPGIFSGGFDLKTLQAGGSSATAMLEGGFTLALRLLELPAPVTIACNGHAVAMGLFLLLCGDHTLGVDGPFRLVANEVAIGLTMPWTAVEICRQRLTPAGFIRIVSLAEPFTPSEAVPVGALDKVVDASTLDESAAAAAAGLARLDRKAQATTKARVRRAAVTAVRNAMAADAAAFRGLRAPEEDH
jgi:enoyl-CoA hydratase